MYKKTSVLFASLFVIFSVTAINLVESDYPVQLIDKTANLEVGNYDNSNVVDDANNTPQPLASKMPEQSSVELDEDSDNAPFAIFEPTEVETTDANTEQGIAANVPNDEQQIAQPTAQLTGQQALEQKRAALNLKAPIPAGTLGGGNGSGGPGSSGPDLAENLLIGGPAQAANDFAIKTLNVASSN